MFTTLCIFSFLSQNALRTALPPALAPINEIFPLSFVADVSASKLRKNIIENHTIDFIEAGLMVPSDICLAKCLYCFEKDWFDFPASLFIFLSSSSEVSHL